MKKLLEVVQLLSIEIYSNCASVESIGACKWQFYSTDIIY